MGRMGVYRVDSIEDPRLAPFRSLKERELAAEGRQFIAEGEHLVRRLLQSDYVTDAVLLAERRAAEIAPLAGEGVPVYVVPDELVRGVIGYRFHSGVIAAGRRKPPQSIDQVIPRDRDRLTLGHLPRDRQHGEHGFPDSHQQRVRRGCHDSGARDLAIRSSVSRSACRWVQSSGSLWRIRRTC